MATGPEHYKSAEAALRAAGDYDYGSDGRYEALQRAQIHATLAHAAATALNSAEGIVLTGDQNAWFDVASEAWCVKHQRYFNAGKCSDCTDVTEPADAYDAYTDAQLNGFACISCGTWIFEDVSSKPVATGPRGQLFEHSNPDDCKQVAQ